MFERRQQMTETERLREMLAWCGQLFALRYEGIRSEHPGAPDYELAALWNERMYRGKVPDALLDAAMAESRRRGELGLPPFDR